MFRLSLRSSLLVLTLALLAWPAEAQFQRRTRRDEGPPAKNVKGIVHNRAGQPIVGAKVMIRDMKTTVIRTLITDAQGLYSIFALPPAADYEVWAEVGTRASDKKLISSFLNRQDNVFNFQLDVTVTSAAAAESPIATTASPGTDLTTFDLVKLRGRFDMPTGVPAPIPSILLLHGYGEDRTVWDAFRQEMLRNGWAVLAIDLRGHGESTLRNQRPIQASTEWRCSAPEFPLDLDPALDFLKAQARLDNKKIVVIGADVGANLALIASGRFPEVRTVVAVNPSFPESLAMAGSAQDFRPRSALVATTDEGATRQTALQVAGPNRTLRLAAAGTTAALFAQKELRDAILRWLRETY